MAQNSLSGHGCSTGMRKCKYCRTLTRSKGIGSHERACRVQKENERKDSEFEREAMRCKDFSSLEQGEVWGEAAVRTGC